MKIHLDEIELKNIIKDYLVNQMPELSRRTFEINFTAGRGGKKGHRAEVEIMPAPAEDPGPIPEEDLSEKPAVTPFNFGDEAADED